jgi:hypothetical protein
MEQDYVDPELPSPTNSSPVTLRYPTVNANVTPFALACSDHAVDMRPPLSRQPSEALSSSLGDSTYDFLEVDDASEDARTESVASVDGEETPDDVSIITSGCGSDDEGESDSDNEAPRQEAARNSEPSTDVHSASHSSGFTAHAPRSVMAESVPFLDFSKDPTEPDAAQSQANLVHVIQSLEEINTSRELSLYGSSHVGLSLHMTVSDATCAHDSFRVLVVSYNPHLAHEVTNHIKTALSAGTERAVDFAVSQCSSISRHDRSFRLKVEGSDGQLRPIHVVGGKSYALQRERWTETTPPNLAIFLHPSLADIPAFSVGNVEDHFALTRHAMLSCQVPIMDLSEYAPLFQAAPLSYTRTRKSLHLRVTTPDQKEWESQVVELLPVDLDKFLAIEPTLLNRHLACIARKSSGTLSTASKAAKRFSLPTSVRHVYKQSCEHVRRVGDLSMVKSASKRSQNIWDIVSPYLGDRPVTMLIVGILIAFSVTHSVILMSQEVSPSRQIPDVNNPVHLTLSQSSQHVEKILTSVSTVTATKTVVLAASVSSAAAKAPYPPVSSHRKDVGMSVAKMLSEFQGDFGQKTKAAGEKMLKDDEDAKRMDLNVVGDHHFILTPRVSTARSQKFKVEVSVARKYQILKTEVNQLPSGAWVVTIDPKQAYGPLTATTTWTDGKKHYKADTQFDLGSAWLKASTWERAAATIRQTLQEDLAVAQAATREISVRVTTGLQRINDDLKKTMTTPAKTNIATWKAIKKFTTKRKDVGKVLHHRSNNIAGRVSKSARIIQQTAVTRYISAIDTIRAVDLRKMLALPPAIRASQHAFKRGGNNARDLFKLIDAHAQNMKNGCWKEYQVPPPISSGKICGLACAKARADRCASRKVLEGKKKAVRKGQCAKGKGWSRQARSG